MDIEGDHGPRMLNQLQEISPQGACVGHNVARLDVWLKLCFFCQVPAQNEYCGIGFFDELDETWLGKGPISCPVVPVAALVAVGNVVQLL